VISKAAMQGVPESIVQRQLAHFNKVGPTYGAGEAKALGWKVVQSTDARPASRPPPCAPREAPEV
jgi:catalase